MQLLGHPVSSMQVTTEELPTSTKDHSIRQITNRFIQIHILSGQRWIQVGMLRVKRLDYQSPSILKTHKPPYGTTGHLEDIIRTARQKGDFLRSSELWDGARKCSLNRVRDTQCCHHTPWKCNVSPRQDIQHCCYSTANLFLRNLNHNLV